MNITTIRPLLRLAALAGLSLLPLVAHAHAQEDGDGFVAGLLHPVFGVDHLLAMISVGIVSAQLGGASIWRVPTAFVLAMVLGGAIGVMQIAMPYAEVGIALSVVLLGIAIVNVDHRTSPWLPLVFVLFFGVFHGHAHGVEMPRSASPAFYTFGFITSTSLLHVFGVVIGELSTRRERFVGLLRYSGAGMAGIGISFLLQSARAIAL